MATRLDNNRLAFGRTLLGGSAADTVAGLAGMVLSILGLVGVVPPVMAALAVLALSAGFLAQGAASQMRHRAIVRETPETHMGPGGFGSGVLAETGGGLSALALGILALIGFQPHALVSISVIAFGGTMILGSTMLYRINEYLITRAETSKEDRVTSDQAARGTSDLHLLVGIGAVVLGIFALTGAPTLSFALVAMIGVGGANLISGSELVNRSVVVMAHA